MAESSEATLEPDTSTLLRGFKSLADFRLAKFPFPSSECPSLFDLLVSCLSWLIFRLLLVNSSCVVEKFWIIEVSTSMLSSTSAS